MKQSLHGLVFKMRSVGRQISNVTDLLINTEELSFVP